MAGFAAPESGLGRPVVILGLIGMVSSAPADEPGVIEIGPLVRVAPGSL